MEPVLAHCRDMLVETVAGICHKPTIGAATKDKIGRMDKDCLCHHRPKQDRACRHIDMANMRLSTKILVRRNFFLSAFLSPHFLGNKY